MKILKYLLLMLAVAISAGLMAQTNEAPGGSMSGGPGRGGRRGMPSVEDQVKHLTEELKLTDAQQTQVKAILQDQREQMKKFMQESSGSRQGNWSKMREIHQQSSAKIRDLLTDEQKPKYDKLEQERRQHMQQRRGGQQSSDQSQPPSPDQQ